MAKVSHRNIGNESAAVKDDTLYSPINLKGTRVYLGSGLPLSEAVHLAEGVLAPTGIARVEADGSLTPGRISRDENERLSFSV
jgi:hypothetical protein